MNPNRPAEQDPEYQQDYDQSVLQQAADWHVLIHSEDAGEGELRDFEHWRQRPEHAAAYREMETIWNRFDASPPATTQTLKRVFSAPANGARRYAQAGTALALTVLLLGGWLAQSSPYLPDWARNYLTPAYLLADYRTDIGEHQHLNLDDRTQVELGSQTAVDIDFSARVRQIHLHQGEIRLTVTTDPNRPLRVVTDQGSATALGTRFIVRADEANMVVSVSESEVRVCPDAQLQGPHCQVVQPGQSSRVLDHKATRPEATDSGLQHDWTQHELIIDNQPLSRVLTELQRYHSSLLQHDSEQLADIRVSGVLPLDDSDRALQILARSLPIKMRHYPLLTRIAPE